MNEERELLIQAIDAYDRASSPCSDRLHHAFEEIRNYLICEPERKPMTKEEIDKRCSLEWFYGSFVEGIRCAEKHHGIGGKE